MQERTREGRWSADAVLLKLRDSILRYVQGRDGDILFFFF